MSMHNPAKYQQNSVIFAKSAANAKIRLFLRYRALFLRTLYNNVLLCNVQFF
jgi:hypothetical protein